MAPDHTALRGPTPAGLVAVARRVGPADVDAPDPPPAPRSGEPPLLLDADAVAARLDVSVSTLHRLVAKGAFPHGRRITDGCVRWHRDTVEHYRLLDAVDVAAALCISVGHFYRMVKERQFPQPDSPAGQVKRWKRSVVEDWAARHAEPTDR